LPDETIVTLKTEYSQEEISEEPADDDEIEEDDDLPEEPAEDPDRENRVVHVKSVSIKGVLKGRTKDIPVANEEISETDQVARAEHLENTEIEITEGDIRDAWKEYAQSIENLHPRIFSTLNQQVPSMTHSGIIQITLNTNAQREYFIETIKPELIRFMSKKFGEVEFVFETNLIDNETTAKKVYTDHDKLAYLTGKNPALEKLRTRFNLDFDN
jgi:DNA polymerase III alpha subunit (gram-positive type)